MRILLGILLLPLVGCWNREPSPAAQQSSRTESTAFPFQEERWLGAELNPKDLIRLDKAVEQFRMDEERYRTIEKMRKTGVPAPIIFALHGRESTWSFRRHLHEGSPLTGRTKYVPKGRPLRPDPPYTFEQSAEDALYSLKNLERINWLSRGDSLQAIEAYNGLGYQRYHKDVLSPYLWAGTSLYTSGKYVADGKFSQTAIDKQLGCAAILMRMEQRGVKLIWLPAPKEARASWKVYPVATVRFSNFPREYLVTFEIRGKVIF